MNPSPFLWAGCAWCLACACYGEERIADVRQGTNIAVALSPDGTTVVVDLIGQLWQLPLSGGAANPLTPTTTIARNPRFSPDGNSIVYQSERADQWDLFLLDVPRGVQRRLTNTDHDETEPDFSADGRAVVFSSDLAGSFDIWQLDVESGELRQLTGRPGHASFPSVSERGEIAYVNELAGRWTLDLLRAGATTELLAKPYPLRAPAWRPGGGIIVFNEQPSSTQSNLAMLLLDANRVTKALTRGEDVFGFRPAWVSSAEFVYTADGQIWRRRLASTTRQAVQLFAGVAVTRPVYPRRAVEPSNANADGSPSDPYVIRVDRLFDGIGNQYRRHMDVHVDGERITAIVARGLLPSPDRVIDARDRTLIPGLIDLHAHPAELPNDRLGRIWLAYGVTTVREIGNDGSRWQESLDRRMAWSADAGPRLLLTSPAPEADDAPANGTGSGFDVFQIYRGRPGQLTPGVLNDVREMGVAIFGQALFPAARFGIDGLEHLGARSGQRYGLEHSALGHSYQDVLSVLIETRTVVTPTLAAFGGFQTLVAGNRSWARDPAYMALYSSPERARWERRVETGRLESLQRMVARLVQAGGRVAAGSDSPSVPYGLGLHAELALLSAAGIPNDQVLRLATAQAAFALGLDRDLGTLEPGKLADFVVLDGNPLARIEDSLRVEAVVKGGVWMDREELMTAP